MQKPAQRSEGSSHACNSAGYRAQFADEIENAKFFCRYGFRLRIRITWVSSFFKLNYSGLAEEGVAATLNKTS